MPYFDPLSAGRKVKLGWARLRHPRKVMFRWARLWHPRKVTFRWARLRHNRKVTFRWAGFRNIKDWQLSFIPQYIGEINNLKEKANGVNKKNATIEGTWTSTQTGVTIQKNGFKKFFQGMLSIFLHFVWKKSAFWQEGGWPPSLIRDMSPKKLSFFTPSLSKHGTIQVHLKYIFKEAFTSYNLPIDNRKSIYTAHLFMIYVPNCLLSICDDCCLKYRIICPKFRNSSLFGMKSRFLVCCIWKGRFLIFLGNKYFFV